MKMGILSTEAGESRLRKLCKTVWKASFRTSTHPVSLSER